MENSLLFYHILKGLGYVVYTAPAKRRPRVNGHAVGEHTAWVHIRNIPTLVEDGIERKYASDVAFGGDGARCPLELVEDVVIDNLGTQQVRLSRSYLPHPTQSSTYTLSTLSDGSPATRFWNYQYRNKPTQEWSTFYSFPEFEFSHADFELKNYWTSTSPQSHQTTTLLIIRFLRDEEGAIVSKRTLESGTVKQFPSASGDSRTEVVEVFTNEEQRVAGIKHWFAIDLTDQERQPIVAWKTELKGELQRESIEGSKSLNEIISSTDNTG